MMKRSTSSVNGGLVSGLVALYVAGCTGNAGNNGSNGVDGGDGLTPLVVVSSEPAGTNCATGGQKITVGLDTSRNGALEANEVTETRYVCNGAAGAQGATGAQGPKGDTGAQGATGATGAQGTTGAKGDTGAQGTTGATGAQGTTGAKGDTGAQGPIGETGPKGDTGAQGPKGDTGAAGADATCAGVAAPTVTSVQLPTGNIYAGLTYSITINATSTRTLAYAIVGSGATFTAGGTAGVFNYVPATAGGPNAYAAIVTNGCQTTLRTFSIANVLPQPKVVYQSKIETNPTVSTWYYLNKPAVVGDNVFFDYAASSSYGYVYMDIWSIATPASPVLQSTYGGAAEYNNNHLWNHRAISVSSDGSRAVLQSDFSSALMDTSTKTSPTLIKFTGTIGAPISGAVSGTTVYIGQSSGGELYWVWDTVANTVTTANNSFGQSVTFNAVQPIGGFLYAASSGTAKGLYVFDPTGPSSTPAYSDTSTYATGLALSGSTLILSSETMGGVNGYLKTYDVSTPASPSSLGQVAVSGVDVAYANGFAYVASTAGITLVDVSAPTAPAVVLTKSPTDLGIASGEAIGAVTISGNKLVVRTTDGSVRDRLYVYTLE